MPINGTLSPDRLAFFQAIADEIADPRYAGMNVTQKSADLETKRFPAPVPAREFRDRLVTTGLWARLEAIDADLDARTVVLMLESINSAASMADIDVESPQVQNVLARLVAKANLSQAEADAISALADNRISRADQIRAAHPTMNKKIVPGRVEQAEMLP